MNDDTKAPDNFIDRVRVVIATEGQASQVVLAEIESELQRERTADLWILRGDAIQLSDDARYSLDDAEASYREALAIDPDSADACESLAHFTYAVKDDARGAIPLFQRAIDLGAGTSARDGMRAAIEESAAS